MWTVYTQNHAGIAIISKYSKLKELLPKDNGIPQEAIFFGEVDYIDFSKETFPLDNAYHPFMHKRISFLHEHEVRAVISNITYQGERNGIEVSIDIQRLIDAVVVSPTSPLWFKEIVEDIMGKYSLNVPVSQSDLDAAPLY